MRGLVAALLVLFAWAMTPERAAAHGAHADAATHAVMLDDAEAPMVPVAGKPCHCVGGCDDGAPEIAGGACCHLAIASAWPAPIRALPRPDRPRVFAPSADGADPTGLERPPRG